MVTIVVANSSEYFGHVGIPAKVNTVVECVPSSLPSDNNNSETECNSQPLHAAISTDADTVSNH